MTDLQVPNLPLLDHSANNANASGDWDRPVPIDTVDLPLFPVDVLPTWQRHFVSELAEDLQTPVDLPALLVLCAEAVAVQGCLEVEVKPGYREPCNIYGVVALPPGARKSTAFARATHPLNEFEEVAVRQAKPQMAEAQSRRKVLEIRLQSLEQKAGKSGAIGKKDEVSEDAGVLARELAESPEIHLPRWLTDDVTPERLQTMLAEQDGRMGVFSAEGGEVFQMMLGRYSKNPNFGVYLKGHAGDALRVDRGSRTEYVLHPCLTLCLVVQPSVLHSFSDRRRDHDPGFRGRGLLGRLLISIPDAGLGDRKINPQPMTKQVMNDYTDHLQRILQNYENRPADPNIIKLSEQALTVWLKFAEDIERQLAPGGTLDAMTDWGAKLPGAVARLALLLHVGDNHLDPVAIPASTMERAVAIGHYLTPHAKAAYGLMGTDGQYEHARHVLKWVLRRAGASFSKRDAFESLKGRFPTVAELDVPLGTLVERGYIREHPHPSDHGPGRPSIVYDVNPYATSQYSQKRTGSNGARGT